MKKIKKSLYVAGLVSSLLLGTCSAAMAAAPTPDVPIVCVGTTAFYLESILNDVAYDAAFRSYAAAHISDGLFIDFDGNGSGVNVDDFLNAPEGTKLTDYEAAQEKVIPEEPFVLDETAPSVTSLVVPNLTITGGPSTWSLAAGATPTAVVGSIGISFNEPIKKASLSDIGLRVYAGNKDVTPADMTYIKNILFNKLANGSTSELNGNINLTYSALKNVINPIVGATATSLQIDVSDLAGNITTLTLNIN